MGSWTRGEELSMNFPMYRVPLYVLVLSWSQIFTYIHDYLIRIQNRKMKVLKF